MQETSLRAFNKTRIMLILITTYLIFAILLNSVGTVILQAIYSFGVSKSAASVLEGFKDLPIAIVSFFFASYLPRLGFKNAMLIAMALVAISCSLMPLVQSFWMTKLQFLTVGVSFALVKISVYSLIGQISDSPKAHASNMSILEGCFMLGVLAGYWLFGFFIDANNPGDLGWLNVYWLLVGICVLNFILILTTTMKDPQDAPQQTNKKHDSLTGMLKLALVPAVVTFVICAFFYVLVEQGIGTWLPTFNNKVLQLPADISVQMTSIFALCLAVGRLSAGAVLRKINWYPLLIACIIAMALLLVVVLPMMVPDAAPGDYQGWASIPLAAFILPLIGVFMAPIYPAINSAVLSTLAKDRHASMTGLIVIFSALGGTLGSFITGTIFEYFDGQTAFYFMLVPMLILVITLTLFKRLLNKQDNGLTQ
jgi:FHS family glucose/mannose:H+ symporter-like MFS transporter